MKPIVAILVVLLVCTSTLLIIGPVQANVIAEHIPVRVIILTDEQHMEASTKSKLFESIHGVLNVNKIPFDVLDITDIGSFSFVDKASNLRYSVLLLLNHGWRLAPETSQLIIEAINQGMGIVGLSTESANQELAPVFGIESISTKRIGAHDIVFLQDKFTFSYKGEYIAGSSEYLNHTTVPDADIVAVFNDTEGSALWTYEFGNSTAVFHNHNVAWTSNYQGILLQSILYAMPIGVACPVNAGAIEIDDGPRMLSSDEELQQYYYTHYTNLKNWLKAYNLTATFFIAFSYEGSTEMFWRYPQTLEWTADILQSGYELGLHCGSKHLPLNIERWGSESAVIEEVDEMMKATALLKERLWSEYGIEMPEITAYVPPTNEIGASGYKALDSRTNIKYVGGFFIPAVASEDEYLPPLDYSPALRGFSWEGDLDIYNLPRIQGGFLVFNLPSDEESYKSWAILRGMLESGAPYIVFTHPDELLLLGMQHSGGQVMSSLFHAHRVWADYVTTHFPFYRWYTTSELGAYLEHREGVFDAEFMLYKDYSLLNLKLSQPNDAIHIKTKNFLTNIVRIDETTLTLRFKDSPPDKSKYFPYEIIRVNHDYFIYPETQESHRPIVPDKPFTFTAAPFLTDEPIESGTSYIPEDEISQLQIALIILFGAGLFLITGLTIVWKGSKR